MTTSEAAISPPLRGPQTQAQAARPSAERSRTYDAIIIGTGQAAPYVAHRLTGAGMKVAIVERHLFGGTCVNTGCTPTKAMVASAYAAHLARRAADYGIVVGKVSVDMKRVTARRDAISLEFRKGVEERLRNTENCTVYQGHARFVSPQEVSVGADRLKADRIFINVGGRALVPPMPGLAEVPFLTNSTVMGLDTVPPHLIVVGGSYVGLEFGQMFRRFGSEVTIIEMGPRLIQREDEDVSACIADILQREGIALRLNATCLDVARRNEQIIARVRCEQDPPEVAGTHLLLAVGRRPNTDDLGLDKAGVTTDKRGYIQVDDQLRTNVPGIWALGDCNGKGAFTHTSYNDAEIALANLLDNDPRRVSDRITAYALYIDPPLGRAGMTEAQARASGRPILIGQRPMSRIARAQEKGETLGFIKVLVDAESRQILGASILGSGGDEVIHDLLDQMHARAPSTVMAKAMHIHPTISELLPTILGDLKPL